MYSLKLRHPTVCFRVTNHSDLYVESLSTMSGGALLHLRHMHVPKQQLLGNLFCWQAEAEMEIL